LVFKIAPKKNVTALRHRPPERLHRVSRKASRGALEGPVLGASEGAFRGAVI